MPNYSDLLGNFLQNATAPSGRERIGQALEGLQPGGPAVPGAGGRGGQGAGAESLLGGLLGAVQSGLSGAMKDPVKAGGLGALAGAFLGGGGDSVKGALGGGALALLAGVAAKALLSGGQSAGGSGAGVAQRLQAAPPTPNAQPDEAAAKLILRAMISAAKADGNIDQSEMQRIIGRLKDSGADQEAQGWVLAELSRPLDLDALVAEIPDAELAAEVYAASLLAVEVDTREEREYLAELARRTGLQPAVVGYIHQTMGVPQA